MDAATHRRLAVELFNRSWRLLELTERTPEQDDELIHCVHASRHHWGEVGTAAQLARGENDAPARMRRSAGPSPPFITRTAASTSSGPAARASRTGTSRRRSRWRPAPTSCATNASEAARYAELARQELETTADPDDREVIESQLAELGV